MWNRVETGPPNPQTAKPQTPAPLPAQPPQQSSVQPVAPPPEVKAARITPPAATATIGSSVLLKGELTSSEDLTVDGQVEGRIDLPEHSLTIGPNANIKANIAARIVLVFGTVTGNITAHEKIDLRRGASVEGAMARQKSKGNGVATDTHIAATVAGPHVAAMAAAS
jgi:hypothetical protein